jgi:hypothetical protein
VWEAPVPVDVTELKAQRKLTAEFIRRGNRQRLTLSYADKVADASGGHTRGPATVRDTQEFHWSIPTTQLPERVTLDGTVVVPEYILVGHHDAVVERGDWFYLGGVKYEVVFIHPDRSYETRAEVVYRG